MSGTAISQLPAAISVINSDLLPVVEIGTPNVTKRLTVAQLLANTISTTGGVFTGSVEFDQGILIDNNQWIQWRDNLNAPQNVITMDGSNNLILRTHGADIVMQNAGGTAVASVDSSGNLTAGGNLSCGTVNASGALNATSGNVLGSFAATSLVANSIASNGAITAGSNITATGFVQGNAGVTAASNGVTYASFGGHAVAWGWDGTHANLYVDGVAHGSMALTSELSSYMPLAGGTFTGPVTFNSNEHILGSLGVDGPVMLSSNVSVGGTLGVTSYGTVGGVGWEYPGLGSPGAHGFAFWWDGSLHCRIDGSTDLQISTVSDQAMKQDIAPSIFDGLAAIRAVPLFQFNWKRDPAGRPPDTLPPRVFEPIGFVAQELAEVFPEAVYDTGKGTGINVNTMLAALVGAVKQLAARVEELEAR